MTTKTCVDCIHNAEKTLMFIFPRKPGRRKSKAEVMAEVIAKSKMHKVLFFLEHS